MSELKILIPVTALLFVLLFFMRFIPCLRRKADRLPVPYGHSAQGPDWPKRRYPFERKDFWPLLLITAVYGCVAFYMLGDTAAPQSFCHFSEKGRYALVELDEAARISRVRYYTGLHTGNYYLQYSADGETFTDVCVMEQGYADLFKWLEADLTGDAEGEDTRTSGTQESGAQNAASQTDITQTPVKYIRIIADAELELGELAIYGEDGSLIPVSGLAYDAGAAPLFDEQVLIPQAATYMNSSYFDEIYHARTAFENIRNVYPYEISHPPLGKLILSLGIKAFGMTPFGWRFMGVVFGILMLPFLYIFIKNLFGSTPVAACGTLIFAFDFMHYVQTRIATIDTYAVFFIILMYFFMYRYVTSNPDDLLKRDRLGLLPLALSGLFFGIGCASKWTCVYAGAGLALIWLLYWIFRGRGMIKSGRRYAFWTDFIDSLFYTIIFFLIVPVVIYYVSYYPYGRASGMSGLSMFINGDYLRTVLDNQKFMYGYHAHLVSTHPYSSEWYKWVLDIRPILYYLEGFDNGTKSTIGAFVNPLLCWGGLLGMFFMIFQGFFRRDKKALFILLGYLSQLVPWMFITRLTFEYHYFPSTVFLTLALCHVFNTIRQSRFNWKPYVYAYTGACLLLFVAFYPVLSGMTVPTSYTNTVLRWFSGTWPF